MGTLELVQDRTISGKGLLRVPTDAAKSRFYILYTDVIRKPKNEYLNYSYNSPRSRYATLVFYRNAYAMSALPVEYPKQSYDGVNDIAGQTLLAVKCAYDGILDTFVNLAAALAQTPGGAGLQPLTKTNLIKDYENLRLAWDEVRVTCYADTLIQCRLYRLKYDVCNPAFEKDFPPPPPPPPKTPIPPGTPASNLSDPYDGSSDSGQTAYYPGDIPQKDTLQGNACVKYTLRILVGTSSQPSLTFTIDIFGPYKTLRYKPGQPSVVELYCRGTSPGSCKPEGYYTVASLGVNGTTTPQILSVT